jgi:microcystin-dependent protein
MVLGAIPWYKSPQTIGLVTTAVAALVALFPKVGQALGLTSPGAISTAVSNVAGFIALIAPIVGTVVRAKSKVQPVTLTQARADDNPATVVAAQQKATNDQNARVVAKLQVVQQQRKAAVGAGAEPVSELPPQVVVEPPPAKPPMFQPGQPWGK